FGITEGGMVRGAADVLTLTLCSTPFGITEGGISSGRIRWDRLNLCSTPFGITDGGVYRGPGAAGGRPSWAQRLSASQRAAYQIQEAAECRVPQVLNAFRHHRGRHVATLLTFGRSRFVLNAFRHHRGRHTCWPAAIRSPSRVLNA